jgi:hypothetical protein
MTPTKISGLLIIALGLLFGPTFMRGVLPISYFLAAGLMFIYFSPERINDERVQQLKMRALFNVLSTGVGLTFVAYAVMSSMFPGLAPAPQRLDKIVSVWDFLAGVFATSLVLFHFHRWLDARSDGSSRDERRVELAVPNGGQFYRAPWSVGLKWSSGVVTIFILAIAVELGRRGGWLLALAPLAFLALVIFSMIRGYEITGDVLLVRHLWWSTRLPLTGLISVEAKPEAMRNCARTFGNGGAFSYSGRYRSERLGTFRAYVSDPARAVVLSWSDRRIVVSPESLDEFIRDVERGRQSG